MRLSNQMNDIDNIRHMTGSDSRYTRKQWGFRNHFCASKSGGDYESMIRLEKSGYVVRGREQEESIFFHATEKGLKAIGFTKKQIENALER